MPQPSAADVIALQADVGALASDLAALAADPGAMLHFSINAVPTTGTFHLDAYWEGGTATAGVKAIVVPADGMLFGLGAIFQSPVGGANAIAWIIDVAPTVAAGYSASALTIPTHATDSAIYVADNVNEVAVTAGSLVRLRGVITGTLASGALFPLAHLRFRGSS